MEDLRRYWRFSATFALIRFIIFRLQFHGRWFHLGLYLFRFSLAQPLRKNSLTHLLKHFLHVLACFCWSLKEKVHLITLHPFCSLISTHLSSLLLSNYFYSLSRCVPTRTNNDVAGTLSWASFFHESNPSRDFALYKTTITLWYCTLAKWRLSS